VKKSLAVLFWLRLFLYFSVTALILLHPGISVTFDRISFTQWFIIIPVQIFIAFVSHPKLTFKTRCVIAGVSLLFISAWAGWFGFGTLQLLLAGVVSFTLTYLLFNYPQWAKPAALEPFFLAWVCLRLLSLSRSGEDAASQSAALTQFIFVWTAVVFLLHSVVIYLCLFPKSTGGAVKEGSLFALAAGALLVLVLVALPPDFVRNSIIDNLLPEKIPEKVKDGAEKGMPQKAGGRQRGRRTVPQNEGSHRQELRGISEYEWQNKTGRGKGGSKTENQYMVMIVAADREPVYMGYAYKGQLDPVDGFLQSQQESLNKLAKQRFFVTWFDNAPEVDMDRERQEVYSISVLPQKYLPYRPVSIDPTILSEKSGPLRYIHQVVSNTHLGDPLGLVYIPSRSLSDLEKNSLAPYMDIPLYEDDEKAFRAYLNTALNEWKENRNHLALLAREGETIEPVNEYMEKIFALLTGFSTYQYNLSNSDELSVEMIKDFLFNSTEGDCVEFSNTLALLGRLAGIPSRVVTGYLAAESLQTPAHLKGLFTLRSKIPYLQQFPLENLYMVTNVHSHSWTQFYIPGYGWLDFEATMFAIPPSSSGDVSNWDVVIPLIDEKKLFSQVRKFPWLAVLRAAGIMAVCALVLAYALRYGRELALYLGTRRGGRAGARSLYLLLLARLAADGKPVKPASKTALEYAQLFRFVKTGAATGLVIGESENPHFKNFASLYTEIRWREFKDSAKMDESFNKLKQEYYNILKTTKRRGIHGWFLRLISLRGLGYL